MVILRMDDEETGEAPPSRGRSVVGLRRQVASMVEHVQSVVDKMSFPPDQAHWLNSIHEKEFDTDLCLKKRIIDLHDEHKFPQEYFYQILDMFERSKMKKTKEEFEEEINDSSNVPYEVYYWLKRFHISPVFAKLLLKDTHSNNDLNLQQDSYEPIETSFATDRNRDIYWQSINKATPPMLEPIRELPFAMKEFVDIILRRFLNEHTFRLFQTSSPISIEKLVESIECLNSDDESIDKKVYPDGF